MADNLAITMRPRSQLKEIGATPEPICLELLNSLRKAPANSQ
jgi:hypothetical protein